MKNEHVNISLEHYNDLRDFKKAMLDGEACVVTIITEYYGSHESTKYISREKASKVLIEEIKKLNKSNDKMQSDLERLDVRNVSIPEFLLKEMTIWQFIKWRRK